MYNDLIGLMLIYDQHVATLMNIGQLKARIMTMIVYAGINNDLLKSMLE